MRTGLTNIILDRFKVLDPSTKFYIYMLIMILASAYYFLTWPIYAGDTDVWFHLDYGRYISATKTINHQGFFSFVKLPENTGSSYWLFQVSIYQLYLLSGYYGLIVLRAVFYIANITLILFFLLKERKDNAYLACILITFMVYLFFLIPRYQLIRPHLIDYLFITASIYAIESGRKKVKFLPVISLLWSNLHGIVFPVIMLISLSYIAEFFLNRLKNRRHWGRDDLAYIIPLVLSMASVFITPLGMELFRPASIAGSDQYLYTQEFIKFDPKELLSYSMTNLQPAAATLFNLILVSSVFFIIRGVLRRDLRISHILLFFGGMFLLANGRRFIYEFALLSLPLLKANMFSLNFSDLRKKITTPLYVLIILALMILPFTYLRSSFVNMPKYPFSTKNLPHGITVFLNKTGSGGTVLNHPNTGGYLRWTLYPKYKIFIDMEFPGFFTNEDFFISANSFRDKEILRKVLAKYNPSFITIPITIKEFKDLIKDFPDYALVFFDDTEVLYANKKQNQDMVRDYGITGIDPFTIIGTSIDLLLKEKESGQFLQHLLRMYNVYPDSGVVNQLIAIVYNKTGRHQDAVGHAEKVISSFPEASAGYRLKADALKALKKSKEAAGFYKKALERAQSPETEKIYKDLGLVYVDMQDYKKAYKSFKKAMNPYSTNATHTDLYYLGSAAFLTGRTEEAAKFLQYAYKKAPAVEAEWKESIKKHLELLGVIPDDL